MFKYLANLKLTLLLSALTVFNVTLVVASSGDFENRKAALIEAVNQNDTISDIVLEAYEGIPINQDELEHVLHEVVTSAEADFRLTRLVRVLFFSDGAYEDQILPVIENIPYWLPDSENLRQYWSENHMIMWMTAEWLLYEKYGWEPREKLRQNLVHWLELKIEYGYYEFLSPIYWPFTSAGLLNLVDFAEDEEIKTLANAALTILYKDALLFVNDKGVYFPTAGRTAGNKYSSAYGSSMQAIMYLLTGLGEAPIKGSIGASNLATSTFDATEAIESWKPEEVKTFKYGHPITASEEIHAALDRQDKIVFDWSAGGYFHPEVAENTLWQIDNYNMSGHEEFELFEGIIDFIPFSLGPLVADVAASITKSSYIGNVQIEVYKNKGVVLSSAENFWKGRLGYQQYPIVATVEETAVYTRCGTVTEFADVPSRQSNTSLPYVDQDENVALIMYRHNYDLPIFGIDNFDVFLKFEEDYFDEVVENGLWIIGRKDDSYVAVRRYCFKEINGHRACDIDDGQTWSIVVGNESTHGSFDEFQSVIDAAQFSDRWYFDWQAFKWVYYGHINVDGKSLEHYWYGTALDGPDNITSTDEELFSESNGIQIYPNPTSEYFTLDLSQYNFPISNLSVFDVNGRIIYQLDENLNNQVFKIETTNWASGTYSLIIDSEEQVDVKRIVVKH